MPKHHLRAAGTLSLSPASPRPEASLQLRREVLAVLQSARAAGGPLLCSLLLASTAMANPENGTVVSGNASIVTASPDRLNVVQSSDRAIINWQGFSIAPGEWTDFQQPGTGSVTLNRVTGAQASTIAGNLTANGTVMLINPNGVLFSSTGTVDVGGLVATTANIRDEDFLANRLNFDQASSNLNASVRNEGRITIANQGLAALVAPSVQNAGVIEARLGKVALGGAHTFSLDFQGDGLLSFSPGAALSIAPDAEGNAQPLVSNTGHLLADGGTVQLAASAVKSVVDRVINTDGVIEARTVGMQEGAIVLSGGEGGAVSISGRLDATSQDGHGGTIRINGEALSIASNAQITTAGATGGGNIDIGRDADGALSSTVAVQQGARISADATGHGDGGEVNLLSTSSTVFAGEVSARGGPQGGDGGNVEISSNDRIGISGSVDLHAPRGATGNLLIDPTTLTIIDAVATSGDQDGAAGDGTIIAGDANVGSNTISRGTLEALSSSTNITLEATGLITVNAMAGDLIDLQTDASHSFTLRSTSSGGIRFLDPDTEIRTQGGAISLQALQTGALENIGKLTSNGGDISLTAAGEVTLANVLNAGAGNVSVTSLTGSIHNGGSGRATGNAVSLSAAFGSVGDNGASMETSTGSLTLATGGNLLVVNDAPLSQLSISAVHTADTTYIFDLVSPQLTFDLDDLNSEYLINSIASSSDLALSINVDRDIIVGTIDAQGGDVVLETSAGAIRDDNDPLTRITGDDLTLTATGALGSSGSSLNTSIASVNATAGTGAGVFLSNTGAFSLTSLTAGSTSQISSTGDLTLGTVDAAGTQLSLTSSAGSVFSTGGPNSTIAASLLNITAGGGSIGSVGTPIDTTATQFNIAAQDGVHLNATGSATLQSVISTNGPIAVTAKDSLAVGLVNAGASGSVSLTSTSSSISAASSGTNVIADIFNFSADSLFGGIGLSTAANTISGTAGFAGVSLNQTGAATLTNIDTTGAISLIGTGNITLGEVQTSSIAAITSGSSILDDGSTATALRAPTLSLTANSGSLGTTSQHLQTDAASMTLTTGGNLLIDNEQALQTLTLTNTHATPGVAHTLALTAPYLQFDVTDDGTQFTISDITALTLNSLSFTGDQGMVLGNLRMDGSITLRATAGSLLDDNDDATRLTGSSISLTANHGSVGSPSTGGTLDINTTSLQATTAGHLQITNLADLASLNLTSSHEDPAQNYQYAVTAPGLIFDVSDSAGGYAFNTIADVSSLGFTFQGDRSITAGSIDLTRTGNLTLTSTAGSLLDDGDKSTRILADSVSLRSNSAAVGSTTGNGYMDVIARQVQGSAAGNFTLHLPYPTNTTSTNGGVTLSSISASGAVEITVDNGDITASSVSGGTNVALTASNGSILSTSALTAGTSLTLAASGSLGTASAPLLTQSFGSLTANGGAGVYVNNSGAIGLLNSTAGGPISIASSSSIVAGAINAGSNAVTLTAGGALTDDGDTGTRIAGTSVNLIAQNSSVGSAAAAIGVATPVLSITSGGNVYADSSAGFDSLSISGSAASASKTNSYSIVAPGLTFAASDDGSSVTLAELANTAALTFGFSTQRSLALGDIDTNGGSATLASVSGSVLDDGDAGTSISAASLALSAGNSLGASGAGNALAVNTSALSLTALQDFFVENGAALTSLAVQSTASSSVTNTFSLTATGQTFALSDNGATHYLEDVSGTGLADFTFASRKNLSLGTITASGDVALTATGGASNTIMMDGAGGSLVTGNSVTLDTLGATSGSIGTSGTRIAVSTPALTAKSTGNTYVTSNQSLSTLHLEQTHASATNYATSIAATNISSFSLTDGATASLGNITASNLDFSYQTDRAIQVGTLNVGAGGAVSLTGKGTNSTQAIADDSNQGTRITAGSINLSPGSNSGYIGSSGNGDLDVTTSSLTVKSTGDIYISNNAALDTLDITASHSQSGNRVYAVSATGLTFSVADQSLIASSGSGTVINNVTSSSDLDFSFASDRTLQAVTINTGSGGSVTLRANSIIDDASSGTKITADSLTLIGNNAGSSSGSTLTELDTNVNTLNSTLGSQFTAGSLHLINDGDLTFGSNTLSGTGTAFVTSSTGSLLSDGSSEFSSYNLTLKANSGSLGASGMPLLLNARSLTLTTGFDAFIDNGLDLVNLTLTNTHAAVRTNTLSLASTNLDFQISDNGGTQFELTGFSDATGINFFFSGDKQIQLGTVDVGAGNALSVSATGSAQDLFDDGDMDTELTAGSIELIASGSIGRASPIEVNTTDLSLISNGDINVADNLDLAELSLRMSTQPASPAATYALSAPNLTFDVTEDGTTTTINDITDTTGVKLSINTAHTQAIEVIDTQPYGTVTLDTSGSLTGSASASSRITAAQVDLETSGGGAIGTLASPLRLSTPMLTLTSTGDINIESDTHIDRLLINNTHGSFGTYAITSPSLTFDVTDDAGGVSLNNITDTLGLNLSYYSDHDFTVGTVNLGSAGNLVLSNYQSATVNFSGDGDTDTRISAVSVNISAMNGAIGAAGSGNGIDMAAYDLSASAGGGGVIANFFGPIVLNSIQANGGSTLTDDGDIKLGSFDANGHSLSVTAGGSILSGTVSDAASLTLNAAGDIGRDSTISTDSSSGTTTLTASAGGSIRLTETDSLIASNVTAGGEVTLGADNIAVGTLSATGSPVTLNAVDGDITGTSTSNLITGSSITLNASQSNAGRSIGTSGTRLRVDTTDLTLNARGSMYVTNLNDLDSLTITRSASSSGSPGGTLSLTGTNLTFTGSDNGTTTTLTNVTDTTGLTLDFTAYDLIAVDTINVGSSSDVTLNSTRNNASGSISATGSSPLITARNLTLITGSTGSGNTGAIGSSGTPLSTAVSSITATAQTGGIFISQAGSLALNNMSSGGALSVTSSSGDLTVGTLSYGNNQPLTLTASGGSLLDDGVNSTLLIGNGTGAINLSAANALGTANSRLMINDQSSNTINASVTGSGDAYLAITGSASPQVNVTVNDGSIDLRTTGTMTLAGLASSTDADGNDIAVTATSGNLTLGSIAAGSQFGEVDLRATTGTINGLNGSNTLSGFDVALNAAAGIGTSGTPLNLAAQNISADTTSGNVYLSPTGTAVLGFVRTGNGLVNVSGSGDIIAANVLSSNGSIALATSGTDATLYAGNINSGSNALTLTATNGQISDDGVAATVISAGSGNFSAANSIGTSPSPLATQLTSLTANVTSSAGGGIYVDQTGDLVLSNLTTAAGGIRVNAASSLSGSGNLTSGAGSPIELTASGGNVSLSGAISTVGANANEATVTITGDSIAVGNVTSTGAQGFNGDTTLSGNLSALSMLIDGDLNLGGSGTRQMTTNASGGAITVNGDIDGNGLGLALTASGGAIDLSGDASDLASFAATADSINVHDVTTTGAQTYTGSVTFNSDYVTGGGAFSVTGPLILASDTSVSTSGGAVTFSSTVDGTHGLTINAGSGAVSFGGMLGGTTRLGDLLVNSSGLTSFADSLRATTIVTDSGGTLSLLGTEANSTGTQSYGEALALNGDKTFTGSTITFDGAVNGATSGSQALNIAGNAVFNAGAGGSVALQSLTVSGTSNLGGTLSTTGNQSYGGAITLASDTTINAGSGITFSSTIDGAHDLTVNTGSSGATFSSLVGAMTRIGALTVNSSGTTTFNDIVLADSLSTDATGTVAINTAIIDTSGAQSYGEAVVLNTDTTLAGSTITLNGTVDGAVAGTHSLSIDGNAVLGQAVGGTAALDSLAVSGDSTISGSAVTTATTQTYGSLTLGADTTLTGVNITVNGAIDGTTTGQESLVISGNAFLGGNVGSTQSLESLTISGTGSLNGSINTAGQQSYGGAVNLAGDSTLTSVGGGIGFASAVNGAHALNVNAGSSDVQFNAVGNATRLGNVIVNSGGATTFNSTVRAASVTTDSTGTVAINAGSIDTTGAQTYNDAVTINTGTTLTGTTVAFGGTVDDAAAGMHALNITGNATFGQSVGATAALNALSVSGTSTVNGGAVTTTGVQNYGTMVVGNDTVLNGSTVTMNGTVNGISTGQQSLGITGNAVFSGNVGSTQSLEALTVSGTSSLDSTVNTAGLQSYGGAVTLAGDSTLASAGGGVSFSSTINGAHALTVNSGSGNTQFNGALGGTTRLGALAINSSGITTFSGAVRAASVATDSAGSVAINTNSIDTTGTQTYGEAMAINADTTLAGTTVTMNGTVDDATAGTHALNVVGNAVFGQDVGGMTALNSLSVSSIGTVNGGAVTTTAAQSYGTLALGGDTALTGSTVTVNGALDGISAGQQSLGITGNAVFGGNVGSTQSLAALTISGTSSLNGTVNTAGLQSYGGAVTLAGDSTVNSAAGGVAFLSTVDGAHALTVNSGDANTLFNAAIGSTNRVDALNINSGGATTFNDSVHAASVTTDAAGTLALNGGSIDTTGTQTYGDAATIRADTTLSGTMVSLQNTLDDSAPGQHDLMIDGAAAFNAAVGETAALKSLAVSGASSLNGAVNTSGMQNYGGAVTLAGDSSLTSGSGGITFMSRIDGTQSLIVNAGDGNALFNAALGGTTRLGSLSVISGGATTFNGNVLAASVITDAPGTLALNGGIIDTTTTQTYGEAVTLGADTTLTATAINLQGSVDASQAGEQGITINGNATLAAAVGNNAALKSVSISGTSVLNDAVITAGSQTYSGAAAVESATTLSSGGSVIFGNTLNALTPVSMTIAAPAGSITFGGAIGGLGPLDALELTAGLDLTLSGAATVNSLEVTTGTGTTTFNGALTASTGGINIDHSLGNLLAFNDAIQSATGVSVTGTGPTQLAADITVTEGPVLFQGPLTLSGARVTIETEGDITFLGISGPSTVLELTAGLGDIRGGTQNGSAAPVVTLRDMIVNSAGTAQFYGTLNGIGGAGTAKFVKGPLVGSPYFFNDVPFGALEFIDRLTVQTADQDTSVGSYHAEWTGIDETGQFPEKSQIQSLRAPVTFETLEVEEASDGCATDAGCEVRVE